MAESEIQTISSAIAAVLPDLPQAVLSSVEDTLKGFGAETIDDLQYITEGDLLPVLKPVQARRLVAAWAQNNSSTTTAAFSSPLSVCSSPPSVSPSPSSSSITSSPSGNCSTFVANWVETFQIPWQKLPEELVQSLERKVRPSPRLRREMVRIVVSEIMKMCNNPTKHNTTEIGKRMVAKYPEALQDVIEGDVIGPGYHSLVKQLQARVENVKRPNTPKIRKRKVAPDESDTEEIPAEQKARVQDTYGCINWEPKYLPLSETMESQQEKKNKMKEMFEEIDFNADNVKKLIQSTYYTQRKDINKGTSIQKLSQEWPFLFKEAGMVAHFQELTGLSLMDTFLGNVEKKGRRLLNFFKNVDAQKRKQVLDALLKFQTELGHLDGCSQDLVKMVLLLLAHFGEKEENLLQYVEETCLAQEVQIEKLPATPCIIVCGSCCFSADTFMLSIDQKVVNDHITSFTSAVCLLFGSFYCFNIHYPVELRSTLEFLQRCFFSINPERGTKVEWNKKKKVLSVNPRVLTLIADLADHEWR
ncbi:uncharacterized protein LOC133168493 [Syngnathus typhle]|uniref:uncharacterized protein LOC133148301 n=1 Tax=Syngnathus typhle TaxID=161592 RepID=UPI002A69FEC6|nr:uncharacterized protein LOC133148301 [Syngnathus typhle]XP_061127398.1 uncharacterized protein LOC133148317 [Syngnathus typhle]XP_061127649.1 uncharacterized protein LOC133148749 [Syngnathus typhle]XP_061133259.1 uncharacterized protein LOC133153177 [Syngnathus typhle]XP_061141753.1 uncharacterized protein LOC133158518 [Syngnathus typhle]XP_061156090.1 uncharacterized protein LOC133168493 [Syngnathus typhle]